MLVAYEIQSYQAGNWKIEAIFDDRQLALIDAERLGNSGRHSAVRVVEESHDDVTGKTANKTIFSSNKIDEHNKKATDLQAEVRREVGAAKAKRAEPVRPKSKKAPPKKKGPSVIWLGLLLVVILGGGIGAMMTLHQM
ncbi:hypothetical protein [Pelagibius sp. Alg239-R121]|uniref:hypothetical protein n=1 Tax=Pelagibius sp. Alg239-R121 TaxID=2993448 RepID=UPI0024A6A338|nr:hypothetical protein [Pelagibius sp. Alg239-R121]